MLLDYLFPLLTPQNLTISLAVVICGLLAISFVVPSFLPAKVNSLISQIIHIYLVWRYPIKDPSGQHSLPTSPYTWPNGQGDIGKFLDGIENSVDWEKDHGQIYRIWSGMRSEVVLTRPEHLQSVFHDSDKHSKASNNNSGYIMSQLLGSCVGLISGTAWQRLRAVTEVPFTHRNSSTYFHLISTHIERHLTNLQTTGPSSSSSSSSSSNLQNGLLHPAEDLKHLPFWIVAEIFYGPLPPPLVAQLTDIMPLREQLFRHVIAGGLSRFALLRWLPTPASKALHEFKELWSSFNKAALAHAKIHTPTAPIVTMTAAVVAGTVTAEQLAQTLDEGLFANLDVTTGGLSWPLVFLAAHPGAQEKVLAELRVHTTTTTTTTTVAAVDGTLDQEKLQKYVGRSDTFLQACISESSRLKPLAAFSVPQSAPTDREVGGYVIPAGTDFVVDSYALNVRHAWWGEDAAEFRPERFMAGKSGGLRYRYWRFGFGPRQCMGRYVADLMIRMLIVKLLLGWKLGMRGGNGGDDDDDEDWRRSKESWITHPDFLIRCEKK